MKRKRKKKRNKRMIESLAESEISRAQSQDMYPGYTSSEAILSSITMGRSRQYDLRKSLESIYKGTYRPVILE